MVTSSAAVAAGFTLNALAKVAHIVMYGFLLMQPC